MRTKIEAGDIVDVYFEYVEIENHVQVLYTPSATGDSWHLQRENGTIVYVNMFAKMVRVFEEGEPNKRTP